MNLLTETGKLINGYDYTNQAWVVNGQYVRCGHPDFDCDCYGTQHEGEICTVRGDGRSETNTEEDV